MVLLVSLVAPGLAQVPVELDIPVPPEVPTAPMPPMPPAPPVPPSWPVRFEMDQHVVFDEESRDVFGMGQDVALQGLVRDNAFLLGQDVVVSSAVDGDLFAGGQTVHIDAAVAGEVYAMGQDVVLGPNGSVGGDFRVSGESVRVEGPVGGLLDVGAGRLVISAPVAGDVSAEVGELVVEGNGSIGGDLRYTAPSERPDVASVVAGDVEYVVAEEEDMDLDVDVAVDLSSDDEDEDEDSWLGGIVSWWMWTGWSYAAHVLVATVVYALGGASAERVGRAVAAEPGRAVGFGVVVSAVLFMGSIAAMALILPLPLGVLGMALFLALLYVGATFPAQAIGRELLTRATPELTPGPMLCVVVGMVPLVVLSTIPWLGTLGWLVVTLAGIGALWIESRRGTVV